MPRTLSRMDGTSDVLFCMHYASPYLYHSHRTRGASYTLSDDYGCNKCTLYWTGSFTRSTPEAVRRVRVWDGDTNDGLGTDRSARIVYCLMAGTVPVILGGGLEDIEVHPFPRAHLQNAGRVSTSVAVIWG